jgi:DinB family protein
VPGEGGRTKHERPIDRLRHEAGRSTEVNTPVPYSDLLGARDPLAILAKTPERIEEMVRGWDGQRWGLSYAPGKWNAAQLMLHLAHDEIGWGNRVRLALTQDRYVAQPYDGGGWVEMESPSPPDVALGAFAALRRLNVALYRHLAPEQRARAIRHPEFGEISVQWIIRILAGHDLHHLPQLSAIAAR